MIEWISNQSGTGDNFAGSFRYDATQQWRPAVRVNKTTKPSDKYYTIMDFLLSKYGLIFTEFDSIDRGVAENTNAFSYALFWRVVYASQFYCLTSRYFGALSILTGKAEATDFAVLVFNENAHFQWIWSDNFWSRDSAPPMAVGEKHRIYNKRPYIMLSYSFVLYYILCLIYTTNFIILCNFHKNSLKCY